MITIENLDELARDIRMAHAWEIHQNCKETGNCETCVDKERGKPCPYRGNPINWRVWEGRA